jgi:hypothetical protein
MTKVKLSNLRLWKDERGVSVILGALLMFVIVVTLYATIQAYQVPIWNRQVEFEHLSQVFDDMMRFKSDVEDVALSKVPKSSDIQLGMRYPNRMFLANPGPGVAGILTSENVTITVEYTIDSAGEPTLTKTYNSNRVVYEAQGTIDSPKLVYEHGVIIRDYGDASATTDAQSLVLGKEIYVPVIIGSLGSKSSMETESIEVRPLTESFTRSRIKSVKVTLDTAYPEVWKELFAAEGVPVYDDLIIDGTTETLSGTHYYRNVSIVNGGTLVVEEYDGTSGGTLSLYASGDIYVDSTSQIVANGAGYRGGASSTSGDGESGEGPGAGSGGGLLEYNGAGGGGAGYGGDGGDGGNEGGNGSQGGDGGSAYGSQTDKEVEMGSGGGSGGSDYDGEASGAGGDGGGAIILRADGNINIEGTISSNGEAGEDVTDADGYAAGGGGGGSGGGIFLYGESIVVAGTISADGGNGGTGGTGTSYGAGGGGGGGGGRLKIIGESVSITGTLSVSGGEGGGPADGADNYIYAFRGHDSKDFWRYDISADSWSALADAPDKVKEGGALAYDGGSYIYAFRGHDSKDFWRYDISADSWSALADAPDKVKEGGALAYDGSNYIYAFRGHDSKDFWRYDISADSWSALADTPDKVKEGGALTYGRREGQEGSAGESGTIYQSEEPYTSSFPYGDQGATSISIDHENKKIIIESDAIRQITFPAGEMTMDALYAGVIAFSTRFAPELPPTYTDIDLTKDYPSILDIHIEAVGDPQEKKTHSTITARVKNVTAPFDIHANLSGLTNDPETYDVLPDYSSPDSISAESWEVPNENTVKWTYIEHPEYKPGEAVIVSFWVYNTEDYMQFYAARVFTRKSDTSWYDED